MEKIKDAVNPKIFDGKVNKAVLYHAIKGYQANKRQGSASTKNRGEVSGGGKKPWRQKGTGRARFGSTRNPLWRHGGVIFGPRPRSYTTPIPQKIRKSALKSSLNDKMNTKSLIVVDEIALKKPKTREVAGLLKKLKIEGKALFVLDKIDANLKLASRNIRDLTVKSASDISALDVMSHNKMVATKAALEVLTKRVSK
ncbi:MAG: 50S ribosomal protein L4 [Candidatus Omnitrophota bacterium]